MMKKPCIKVLLFCLQATTQLLRELAALRGPPLEQLKLSVDVLSDVLNMPFVR